MRGTLFIVAELREIATKKILPLKLKSTSEMPYIRKWNETVRVVAFFQRLHDFYTLKAPKIRTSVIKPGNGEFLVTIALRITFSGLRDVTRHPKDRKTN